MGWIDLSLPMDDCDFFVYLTDILPHGIFGLIKTNGDGTYSILLNKDRLYEQQQDDYWHEYRHLALDDFTNGRPITEIESRK